MVFGDLGVDFVAGVEVGYGGAGDEDGAGDVVAEDDGESGLMLVLFFCDCF